MSAEIDSLFLAVSTERSTGSLCEYPVSTVQAARREIERLTAEVRATRDPSHADTIDAIADLLDTLATFREGKLLQARDGPVPLTASADEVLYHAAVVAATATLRASWRPA